MGHTNYWMVHTDKCQGAYNLAKEEMRSFMHLCLVKHKIILDIHKETDPLTDEKYDDISFNGIGDEGCEEFFLPELIADVFKDSFPFCKTNDREYDVVVVGCLFILKKYLGSAVTIKSDGFQHRSIKGTEWNATEYTDDGIKRGYELFKEFQTICPNGWKTGGIIPLFKNENYKK